MKNVLESSMEEELVELFVNFQRGVALRIPLNEMGHHKPPTPGVTDSSIEDVFVNDNIQQHRARVTDMVFNWVNKRVIKGHYLVYWERGKNNLENYFTKHHPTKHHLMEWWCLVG